MGSDPFRDVLQQFEEAVGRSAIEAFRELLSVCRPGELQLTVGGGKKLRVRLLIWSEFCFSQIVRQLLPALMRDTRAALQLVDEHLISELDALTRLRICIGAV